jgi:XTP/dITP diphosphohydrolase
LNNTQHLFTGIVNGKIIEKPKGTNGFGYDPIFIPEGYLQTFAELSMTEKSKISHRANAVSKMIDFLKKFQ